MMWTLMVIVLIVVVGVSVLAYRNRSERGIESGILSFRRELSALAPESDRPPRSAGPAADPPRTSGVGMLRPEQGSAPGHDDDGEEPEDPVDGHDAHDDERAD